MYRATCSGVGVVSLDAVSGALEGRKLEGGSLAEAPSSAVPWRTLQQLSQTRTGFSIPNFGMVLFLDEHFWQKSWPQHRQWCFRLVSENRERPEARSMVDKIIDGQEQISTQRTPVTE